MKYFKGKIKQEHHILKEFRKILEEIENIYEIQKIIPGRISRQQKGTSSLIISFSYFTNSGLKYNLKKGSTVQELFIVCKNENKNKVKEKIDYILKNQNVGTNIIKNTGK